LKLYGHKDVRLINGGRKKWLEEKRAVTKDPANVAPASYHVSGTDESLRARKKKSRHRRRPQAGQLVDVRSVDEFTGKIIAPPGMTETASAPATFPKPQTSVGASLQRRWHLQVVRRPQKLYESKASPARRSHRLLPHRRAQLPHLVRPQVFAGLQPGPQLRRLVTNGQPDRRPIVNETRAAQPELAATAR